MPKLKLDAWDLEPGKPADLGPFRVTVHNDDTPENPLEADTLPPAAWISGGRGARLEIADESAVDPFADVSDAWTSRHAAAIAQALGLDPEAEDLEAREQARDYGETLGATRCERFRERLGEMRADAESSWSAATDFLEALESLWTLRGVPALDAQRNGYRQGDTVRILFVMTPAWADLVGCPYAQKPAAPGNRARALEDMGQCADTFAAWAFGDAWGYTLEDRRTGDYVDSCWGFLGVLWEGGGGLVDAIEEAAAGEIKARHKARLERVKAWVRNRVPLDARAQESATLGALA